VENQDRKREQIIEAALKRFAHFGLSKTTMTEIAADLSLSKALLYYYFPDKTSLYKAVVESIVEKVRTEIETGISTIADPRIALDFNLETRNRYIRRYYTIFEAIGSAGAEISPDLLPLLQNANAAEERILEAVITKIPVTSPAPPEAARLLTDIFRGIRINAFIDKKHFVPSEEEFSRILDKQKQVGHIFLKGISV
jgi:TetR/AcrR family transcriptional regulator